MRNPVAAAARALGGPAALARAVGVSPPAAHQWITGIRPTPADRCPAIEKASLVPVEALRPDVRWLRVPDPTWPNPAGRPCIDVAGESSGAAT